LLVGAVKTLSACHQRRLGRDGEKFLWEENQ
jgi:hypothetical protein